ncbi:hypothetical protein KSD_72380 [Ktedonobacter sp. SOSP1-85]|nr:hypothetical protein KSD_72380 [Ktedonobacter sp. SOSP1-85]
MHKVDRIALLHISLAVQQRKRVRAMNKTFSPLGIDTSKATLDVCLVTGPRPHSKRFPNSQHGYEQIHH